MQKALELVRRVIRHSREEEAELEQALAVTRETIAEFVQAEAEILAAGEAPDEAGDDEPAAGPARNGPARPVNVPTVPIRKLASPPPPAVSSAPDTTAKIARALARGPLMLGALVAAVGMSQPPVSSRLARHSGTGCPERLRYFERTAAGWQLTERGRKEFLGGPDRA